MKVDHQNNAEETALMKAVQIQNIECMILLMKARANVELKDKLGNTAISLAAEFDMNGIVEAIAKRLSS